MKIVVQGKRIIHKLLTFSKTSQVLGIDSSHTQIEFAPKHIPNCDFKVASAHDLQFIHEETVDMVCSGMAFNLMPSDK